MEALNPNKESTNMNFGQAIESLKQGKKVTRKGWSGKNMWLVYMPPFTVEEPNERTRAHGITEGWTADKPPQSCPK
jgi:hypothetical protein